MHVRSRRKDEQEDTICKVFSRLLTATLLSPLIELAEHQEMLDMGEKAGQQRCSPDKGESGWGEASKCSHMLLFPPGSFFPLLAGLETSCVGSPKYHGWLLSIWYETLLPAWSLSWGWFLSLMLTEGLLPFRCGTGSRILCFCHFRTALLKWTSLGTSLAGMRESVSVHGGCCKSGLLRKPAYRRERRVRCLSANYILNSRLDFQGHFR